MPSTTARSSGKLGSGSANDSSNLRREMSNVLIPSLGDLGDEARRRAIHPHNGLHAEIHRFLRTIKSHEERYPAHARSAVPAVPGRLHLGIHSRAD